MSWYDSLEVLQTQKEFLSDHHLFSLGFHLVPMRKIRSRHPFSKRSFLSFGIILQHLPKFEGGAEVPGEAHSYSEHWWGQGDGCLSTGEGQETHLCPGFSSDTKQRFAAPGWGTVSAGPKIPHQFKAEFSCYGGKDRNPAYALDLELSKRQRLSVTREKLKRWKITTPWMYTCQWKDQVKVEEGRLAG